VARPFDKERVYCRTGRVDPGKQPRDIKAALGAIRVSHVRSPAEHAVRVADARQSGLVCALMTNWDRFLEYLLAG